MLACALRSLKLLIGLLSIAGVSLALASPPRQSTDHAPSSSPTVTFTLNFPHSEPENYSISIDSSGHARYECTGSVIPDSQPDTYRSEFELSLESREKIFAWAKQAHYFAGNIDSGNRKLAFTGTKILIYHDAQRDNTARYDYSNLAPVRELTDLFQGMATTLEYGRRLVYYHRYQKLALDDELKRMEAQAKSNELSEIQSVTPVLQEIVDDNSVLNITRARAQELMQLGHGSSVITGHNER
jgi:hypothetical protein